MIRPEVKLSPHNSRGAWSLPSNQTSKTKPVLGSLIENTKGVSNRLDENDSKNLQLNDNDVNSYSPNSSPKVVSHKWLRKHLTLLPSRDDGRLKVRINIMFVNNRMNVCYSTTLHLKH